jgi:hypothetical protein
MLGHQRWPYVGRFARGWHRLPGMVPGQPQTRTRARLRIGSPGRAAQRGPPSCDRSGGGHGVDLRRTRLAEDVGGGGHRRARGEDVVDKEHTRGRRTAGAEDAVHRHAAFGAGAPRLRRRRDRTAELASCGPLQPARERDGQRPRLVEPPLRASSARERDPRHHVDVGDGRSRRDRVGERRRDVTPSRELQSEHRSSSGPVVHERGSRRRERRRRAVRARGLRLVRGCAASRAPGRLDRPKVTQAVGAERPRAGAAAGARPREQRVEHPAHRATVAAAADTPRAAGRRWATRP